MNDHKNIRIESILSSIITMLSCDNYTNQKSFMFTLDFMPLNLLISNLNLLSIFGDTLISSPILNFIFYYMKFKNIDTWCNRAWIG